jgi:DNA-directed RNA polymerase subunit RPC12/RpoP
MRAISIKCPNCNASLEAGESAHKVRCNYCGTESRIQHRTRFLERKIELPKPKPAERKMPVAKQRHGRRWIAIITVITTILPLAVGGAIFWTVMEKVGGIEEVGNALGRAADVVTGDQWTYGGGGNALMYDVNGDEYPDIIAPIRYVQKDDSYYLAAFEGRGGSQLWKSETFGNHDDANQGVTVLHNKVIGQADSRGNFSGFSADDGKRLWKVSLGEKVRQVCADSEISLALKLTDKTWKNINLADGTIITYDDEPNTCGRVAIHARQGQVDLDYSSANRRRRRPKIKIDGMRVDELISLLAEPGHQVALGHKDPGTRIPMVAYLKTPQSEEEEEGESKKKRRKKKKRKPKAEVMWSSELPALDPLSVDEGAPEFVGVNKSFIATIYEPKEGAPHVVLFSREGGQRIWDSPLPGDGSFVITSIDMTPERVYVGQWGRLNAFDIEQGRLVFSLGR